MKFDLTKIYADGVLNGGEEWQDGDINGGYAFSFKGTGYCAVSRLEDRVRVGEFFLDKRDIHAPHSNAVCFAKEKFTPADEFPLLYSNMYNNDENKKGVCNVYRITREGEGFTSALVQVIKIGFTDQKEWVRGVRPYGNFLVAEDRLYAFAMDDEMQTTKFYAFALPKLSDGEYEAEYGCNVVTLRYDEVLEEFQTEYMRYMQGGCYHDGKIYSTEGFSDDLTENIPAIRVIDLRLKAQTEKILLPTAFGLTKEPEFITVYGERLYYKDAHGNLYYFARA